MSLKPNFSSPLLSYSQFTPHGFSLQLFNSFFPKILPCLSLMANTVDSKNEKEIHNTSLFLLFQFLSSPKLVLYFKSGQQRLSLSLSFLLKFCLRLSRSLAAGGAAASHSRGASGRRQFSFSPLSYFTSPLRRAVGSSPTVSSIAQLLPSFPAFSLYSVLISQFKLPNRDCLLFLSPFRRCHHAGTAEITAAFTASVALRSSRRRSRLSPAPGSNTPFSLSPLLFLIFQCRRLCIGTGPIAAACSFPDQLVF